MHTAPIETDYLIIGAGACGMAFADTLLSETRARITLVDNRHRPGGHWNDAYPFVRLHQPSYFYGVNSQPLGSGRIDAQGFNKGLQELASGAEVLSYFDNLMRQHFLPSGRVQYFPMSEVEDDNCIVSRVSGERRRIDAGKIVDARYLSPSIPATSPPKFSIAPGMTCVPIGELPKTARPGADYVVMGAGKTGMDACLWLLENGANPEQVRWVMPRDSWIYNRACFQPGSENLATLLATFASEVEALAEAKSVDEVFSKLEAKGAVLRIDRDIKPTMHHCATVTLDELAALRSIRNVLRLGRIQRIEAQQIVLERGSIPTTPNTIHINCTASALNPNTKLPVFAGKRITLQFVRLCAPTFSAALIAHLEAGPLGEAEKNALAGVVEMPTDPLGWLRMMQAELLNRIRWATDLELMSWMAASRLDFLTGRVVALKAADVAEMAEFERYSRNVEPALGKIGRLLGLAETGATA